MGKQLVLSLLSMGGIFRLGEMLSSRNLLVLTYHRVIPRGGLVDEKRPPNTHFCDEFDMQMDYVAQRFNVLSGNELRAFMEGTGTIPRYAIAITFDDGYENNFSHALPILQRHGLHAVFFVTANLIGHNNRAFWFDRLDRLLAAVSAAEIRERIRQLDASFSAVPESRIHGYFKKLSSSRQSEVLDDMELQFKDAAIPAADRTVHGLMSWDQVRSMAASGMTIGSHTANHQILAAVTPAEAEQELLSSRHRIEQETGQSCWCFAYPNGERRDFRSSDEIAVKSAGYLCAFTQMAGSINSHSPRFALPRIAIPDTGDMKIFRSYVSGVQRTFRAVFPEQ